jgi:Ca2+/Na+ antiporter
LELATAREPSTDLSKKISGLERFRWAVREVIKQQREAKNFVVPTLDNAPPPKTWRSRIFYVITFPLVFLFKWTVIDCRKERFKKWYPLTFLISMVYIAIFCQFMVSWSTYVGCFLTIPNEIMGLTLIAAGSSLPELFSSAAVAKQGLGVFNTFFFVCFCLFVFNK